MSALSALSSPLHTPLSPRRLPRIQTIPPGRCGAEDVEHQPKLHSRNQYHQLVLPTKLSNVCDHRSTQIKHLTLTQIKTDQQVSSLSTLRASRPVFFNCLSNLSTIIQPSQIYIISVKRTYISASFQPGSIAYTQSSTITSSP